MSPINVNAKAVPIKAAPPHTAMLTTLVLFRFLFDKLKVKDESYFAKSVLHLLHHCILPGKPEFGRFAVHLFEIIGHVSHSMQRRCVTKCPNGFR